MTDKEIEVFKDIFEKMFDGNLWDDAAGIRKAIDKLDSLKQPEQEDNNRELLK